MRPPRSRPEVVASPPGFLLAAMADDFSDLLREFDEAMEDFARGPARQSEQHLEELKRKAGHSVYDSGIDELESESGAGGISTHMPALTPLKVRLNDLSERLSARVSLGTFGKSL
uniref:Uncharacterized protein n=1 Tax=Anas zonorhyncha TaxID=75864 RepID=A0A8B9V3C8_9AVES